MNIKLLNYNVDSSKLPIYCNTLFIGVIVKCPTFLLNALNHIFKWLLTKLELSYVRNIYIHRSRKRL